MDRGAFGFRPLERQDLPLLLHWLSCEHVAAWWDIPSDPEDEYFDDGDPVAYYLVVMNGTPIGMVQFCRWGDYPDEAAAVGARDGDVGLDYLIGEPDLIGRGIGPAMLEAFLTQVVRDDSSIAGVRIDVAIDNHRSWRCLEKIGFQRDGPARCVIGEPGPHYVYVLEDVEAAIRGALPNTR